MPTLSSNLVVDRLHGHSAIVSALSRDSVILDIGANQGAFATEVTQRFGSRIVCVEPTPALADALATRSDIQLVRGAASATSGEATFTVDANSESSSLLHATQGKTTNQVTVKTYTLDELLSIANAPRIDYCKMDIEGAEFDILETVSRDTITRFAQLNVEFHESIYRELKPRLTPIFTRLESFGFIATKMSLRHNADVLFVNTAHFSNPPSAIRSACNAFRIKRWLRDGMNAAKHRIGLAG